MKPAIYFIPGWGYSPRVFPKSLLNQSLIYLDYPNDLGLVDIADHLAIQIQPASLVMAWSFGGLVATMLANRYPHLIHKMIFISSQPKFIEADEWVGVAKANAEQFLNSLNEKEMKARAAFIAMNLYPSRHIASKHQLNQHLMHIHAPHMKSLLSQFMEADLRHEYTQLQCPMLHIINDRDAIMKQDNQCLKRLNSNVNTMIVPGAGHAGFLTHADVYREMINEFFQYQS